MTRFKSLRPATTVPTVSFMHFAHSRARVLALLCLGALALAGCRKKTAPEYYGWESNYSILVARDGDDAYASPDMDAIVAGLAKIPADTLEGPKAAALSAKIAGERARIAAEKEAATPPPTKEWVPPATTTTAVVKPPDKPPEDAGAPTAPWAGMAKAEFVALFGACMKEGKKANVPGLGEVETYVVQKTGDCEKKYGSNQPDTDTVFLFAKDRLAGQRYETKTQVVVDAGVLPVLVDAGLPPPAEAPLLPGMPVPEGYRGIPGVPQGAPPPQSATPGQ